MVVLASVVLALVVLALVVLALVVLALVFYDSVLLRWADMSVNPVGSSASPREVGPAVETVSYDAGLPIVGARVQIMAALADYQVVIVSGETGSGKTTQLPKMCLELGRRSIAHTQPRRIAARSVAERIAEELDVNLGALVGYQVRFTRRASRTTRIKVMTDGVLLAEIASDRDLRRYDTVIVDEAHERSLNIDFLLGYLHQLRSRRPDLKIVVTSATIDTARFAAHFAGPDGTPAPVVEVPGRSYPVEIRYRPMAADGQADQIEAVTTAVRELAGVGGGDILVFLSGEREIRDAAEAVTGLRLPATEILPLYARLSAVEQHRVFTPPPAGGLLAGRRVVLATNVAETSLTVPGVRFVVDAGTARISRYSARTKVQRLPIEPVSRASADQRAGRCGRVAPGVCLRLYSEQDYAGRPEFTEPEILRTNLASVILQMAAADLGDIGSFPFVEAPDASQIADGLRLLTELGALADTPGRGSAPRLSRVGRRLAGLPVDPRLGRMLLAAEREGSLREVLVVVAGLTVPDPRDRPADRRDVADALHRRFWAPTDSSAEVAPPRHSDTGKPARPESAGSDFLAYIRLWDYLRHQQQDLSGNAFRRLCREEFLHFLRIREWQDLHAQLTEICRELGLRPGETPADPDRVHRALLAGLLSHVGLADLREDPRPGAGGRPRRRRAGRQEYLGARGTRFAINPGSSLATRPPPLVMAADVVETSRLWARTVAGVTARQVEEVGAHLVKRHYAEPHWSATAGAVMAYEQVSLYGVPIVARRRVPYARINSAEAREIFLRSALVEGQWRTRHQFLAANAEVRAQAEALEERRRRRDLVVDDQAIFDFYAARVPAEVTSAAHFDAWWKQARPGQPDLLTLTMEDLLVGSGNADPVEDFPDTWRVGDHDLALSYRFDPTDPRDGVSVAVPVALLNQVPDAAFSWQVPGLRTELATELIRSLPKTIRRTFVPALDFAVRSLAWLGDHPASPEETLSTALGRALLALTGEQVPGDRWGLDAVPSHLRVTHVVTRDEEVLAEGKDLGQLRTGLTAQLSEVLADAAAAYTRTQRTRWDFGRLPPEVELTRDGHRVIGYPALADEGTTIGVLVADTAERARTLHRAGLRRLVLLSLPDPTRWVVTGLTNADKLALADSPYASVPTLLADARLASVGALIQRSGLDPRDQQDFVALGEMVRADQAQTMRSVVAVAVEALHSRSNVLRELRGLSAASAAARHDLTEQVNNLVFSGFLSATSYAHLIDLPRYLQAAERRLASLSASPARDDLGFAVIGRCEDAYAALVAQVPPGPLPDFVDDVGWLLEELRVSLFAQPMRTKAPVSEKRVRSAIAAARARLERPG